MDGVTGARSTPVRASAPGPAACGDDRGRCWAWRALLVVAAGAAVVLPAVPAAAEELVVTITSEGVAPSPLEASTGDTVRFVSQDPTFAYRAQSTAGAWEFDSGPTELLDGDYLVPTPLTLPGTYRYRVAQDAPFAGVVVVAGPGGTPPAVGTPPAAGPPAPAATAAPRADALPGTVPGASAPPARAAPAVPGRLPGAVTSRDLGLPVALAALLVLGAASLLVRLVLTEARRQQGAPGPLRAGGGRAARW